MAANTKGKKRGSATKGQNGFATILVLIVASLPLYPAIRINLDAAQGQGATWATVAVGFVIFGAICIENCLQSLRDRQFMSASLWGVLGAAFLALNVMNALANAAGHSDHSRDEKRFQIEAAAALSSRKSHYVHGRDEQAKVAGEATPESIEAQLRAAIAADANRWRASEKCNPDLIGRPLTRIFCEDIHKLEAKKAAAIKRDELDTKITKLDDEGGTGKGEAPSSIDPFADAMADAMGMLGYKVDENGKLLISRIRDWGKALGVELLAGFGPTGLLLLLLRAGSRHTKTECQPKLQLRLRRQEPDERLHICPAAQRSEPPVAHLPVAMNDPAHSFITRRLERCEGVMIPAGDLWRLWQQDCEQLGIRPGTQQAFGRNMKKWFAHEKNNGRPRYLNLRAKPEQATLRLAVDNSTHTQGEGLR
jgi:hypothetical protein